MAENKIALHEQSILKIGESVSKNFTDIAKSLPMQLSLPGMAGVPALAGAEGLNAADQTFEERSLSLLESIEISIVAMMNTMVDLLAVEEDQLDLKKPTPSFTKEQSREDDKEKPKGPGIIERGMDAAKEKAKQAGKSLMSLLKTTAIIGLLAGAFALVNKYADEIATALVPVVDWAKKFWTTIKDDIGPVWEGLVDTITTAFSGLFDIFKGLFEGDAATFLTGVKKVFIDFPIKLLSVVAEAFFALGEAALTAFGLDATYISNIKLWFRYLPERVEKFIGDAITFITDTIPEFFTNFKANAVALIEGKIQSMQDLITEAWKFITDTIPTKIGEFRDNIVGKFDGFIHGIFDPITDLFRTLRNKVLGMVNVIIEKVNKIPGINIELFDVGPKVSEEQIKRDKEDEQSGVEKAPPPLSTSIDEDQRKHTGDIKTSKDFLKESKKSDFFDKEIWGDSIINRDMIDDVPTKNIKAILKLESDDLSKSDIEFLESELRKRKINVKSDTISPIVPAHITSGATLNQDSAAIKGSTEPVVIVNNSPVHSSISNANQKNFNLDSSTTTSDSGNLKKALKARGF